MIYQNQLFVKPVCVFGIVIKIFGMAAFSRPPWKGRKENAAWRLRGRDESFAALPLSRSSGIIFTRAGTATVVTNALVVRGFSLVSKRGTSPLHNAAGGGLDQLVHIFLHGLSFGPKPDYKFKLLLKLFFVNFIIKKTILNLS